MSHNPLDDLTRPDQTARPAIGGSFRVARVFLPAAKESPVIRLSGRQNRDIARRQLARLIEPRRMSS